MDEGFEKCPRCYGRGHVKLLLPTSFQFPNDKPDATSPCYLCGGTGSISWLDEIIQKDMIEKYAFRKI